MSEETQSTAAGTAAMDMAFTSCAEAGEACKDFAVAGKEYFDEDEAGCDDAMINGVILQMNHIQEENCRRLEQQASELQSSRATTEQHAGRVRELEQQVVAQAAEAKVAEQTQAESALACSKRLEASEKQIQKIDHQAIQLSRVCRVPCVGSKRCFYTTSYIILYPRMDRRWAVYN